MNLVRLGHYHVPSGEIDADGNASGSCQTALVVKVWDGDLVNLKVWQYDGDDMTRSSVPVSAPLTDGATFHLSGDCPWSR